MSEKTTALVRKEIADICKKYNMRIAYRFTFPMYRKLPDEVQLALAILERHEMRVVVEVQQES